jgi:RNA-directed DNA polymerase
LLSPLSARIVDRHVLRLIKLWLKTPVEETDRRMTGGQRSCTCGTPQGGVMSPLLTNRYMNQSLHWPRQERSAACQAHVVNGSALPKR